MMGSRVLLTTTLSLSMLSTGIAVPTHNIFYAHAEEINSSSINLESISDAAIHIYPIENGVVEDSTSHKLGFDQDLHINLEPGSYLLKFSYQGREFSSQDLEKELTITEDISSIDLSSFIEEKRTSLVERISAIQKSENASLRSAQDITFPRSNITLNNSYAYEGMESYIAEKEWENIKEEAYTSDSFSLQSTIFDLYTQWYELFKRTYFVVKNFNTTQYSLDDVNSVFSVLRNPSYALIQNALILFSNISCSKDIEDENYTSLDGAVTELQNELIQSSNSLVGVSSYLSSNESTEQFLEKSCADVDKDTCWTTIESTLNITITISGYKDAVQDAFTVSVEQLAQKRASLSKEELISEATRYDTIIGNYNADISLYQNTLNEKTVSSPAYIDSSENSQTEWSALRETFSQAFGKYKNLGSSDDAIEIYDALYLAYSNFNSYILDGPARRSEAEKQMDSVIDQCTSFMYDSASSGQYSQKYEDWKNEADPTHVTQLTAAYNDALNVKSNYQKYTVTEINTKSVLLGSFITNVVKQSEASDTLATKIIGILAEIYKYAAVLDHNSKDVQLTIKLSDDAESLKTKADADIFLQNLHLFIAEIKKLNQISDFIEKEKASTDYTQSSSDKRSAFDAIANQVLELEKNRSTLSVEDYEKISTLLDQLYIAHEELNGFERVNDAINNLELFINDYSNIIYSERYRNSTLAKREQYRNAYTVAKEIYDTYHDKTKQYTLSEIQKAQSDIINARDSLDGKNDLEVAKERLQAAILMESVVQSGLNDKQQEALKTAIAAARNDGDMRLLQQTVVEIAREQGQLKTIIDSSDTVKNSSRYQYADILAKKRYEETLEEARRTLDEKSDVDGADDIKDSKNKIDQADKGLSGVSPYSSELSALIDNYYSVSTSLRFTGSDISARREYVLAIQKGRFVLANPDSTDEDYTTIISEIREKDSHLNGDLPRKIVAWGFGISFVLILLGYTVSQLIERGIISF